MAKQPPLQSVMRRLARALAGRRFLPSSLFAKLASLNANLAWVQLLCQTIRVLFGNFASPRLTFVTYSFAVLLCSYVTHDWRL